MSDLASAFSRRARWIAWAALAVVVLFLAGCTSPLSPPSRLCLRAIPPTVPPPGMALIQIHRPRAQQGYKLYTGVYDSTNMVADLGNGHSVAYVCDPGTHYLINRSVERVGVVEARVLADKTYHLRVGTAGAFIASFQLEPIKKTDSIAKKIPAWTKDHIWVTRALAAARPEGSAEFTPTGLDRNRGIALPWVAKIKQEESVRAELELILRDFVNGPKKDRLRHLDPDDSR